MAKTKPTQELQIVPKKLNEVIETSKIDAPKAQQHAMAFAPSIQAYVELENVLPTLNRDSPTETDAKSAREARLKMVKVRTGAEEIKDARKEGIRAEGDLIQSLYNVVKNSCIVTEGEFLAIEKHQERLEAERQEKLHAERAAQLAEFGTDITYLPLGKINDEQFAKIYDNERLLFAAKQAEVERQEKERIERERQEEEARQEQLRLQAERIEAERLEAIRIKEELALREAELQKEREQAAAEQKRRDDEMAKEREAQRVAAEKMQKENDAKLAEQARLAKIEADKQAKLLAEQKRINDIELEKQRAVAELAQKELQAKKDAEAKIEADRKLAELAPDKEKINALYLSIKELPLPIMATKEADEFITRVAEQIRELLMFIKTEAKNLK